MRLTRKKIGARIVRNLTKGRKEGCVMGQREVGKEIHALSLLLSRKMEAQKRKRQIQDITPVQTWVIQYLHNRKDRDVFQRDLEQDFSITRSTVTGILQLMEKNGFISRVSVPEDARLKKLVLTQKGEEAYQAVRSNINDMENRLVAGLSQEEIQSLFGMLDRIRENLEA